MLSIDWNAAVNVMRKALPSAQFKNWVEPLSLIHCENDRIVLGVPSKFHEEWVRNNYSSHITNALHHTCGRQLSLEFEVFEENVEAAHAEVSPLPIARILRVVEPSPEPTQNPPPNSPRSNHPFFELESNRIAFQCASHFIYSQEPMSPLIVEGGVGMGKTHLISHIAAGLYQKDSRRRIYYTNSESFASEMYQSYQNHTHASFRQKYGEKIDVLLFDDFHMMVPKKRAQEELLHIFNEITARNGQIVFASFQSIAKLEGLIEPLRSRLMAGVVADIQFPSFDDRTRLLAQVALHQKLALDDLTLRRLADQGRQDNRKLISILLQAHLQAQLANRPLDCTYLSEVGFAIEDKKETVTLEEIVALIEHSFGVSRENLVSKCRKSELNWARQVAMYLARCYTHLSMDTIGAYFGRNHATVVHSYQKVSETMEAQTTRRYEVQYLKQKLQSRAPKNHVPF